MRWMIVLGAALAMLVPVLAKADEAVPQIVVRGEGRVATAPDMAVVQFGVSHRDARAQTAMDRVSRDVRAIFQAMVEAGVAPADIQTTALRLDPVWENRARDNQGAPEIRGFVATNDVEVRLRDMATLGETLQSLLQEGANRFSSIQFTLSDPRPAEDAARRAAVADARRKAALYSDAAGVTLGPLLSLTEGGAIASPRMLGEARMAMSEAMPVAGGDLDVRAQVTLTYAISP